MEKRDIRELRKAMKAKEPPVGWVYGLYVSAENQVGYECVTPFYQIGEEEQFRHLQIFSKTLSPKIGRDFFPVSLASHADSLLALCHLQNPDVEDFADIKGHLLREYAHTDPYYATIAKIVYDVPAKAKDGAALEDGEMVYEALLFSLCPASLSKAALGYDRDCVSELSRRWQIGTPESGFLYPSFNGRVEDRNETVIYSADPSGEDFICSLFGISGGDVPVGPAKQKDALASLFGAMDMSLASCAEASDSISQRAGDPEADPFLDRDTVRMILESSGAKMDKFDEAYDGTVGETVLSCPAVADPYVTVKTDSATVKVPSGMAELVRVRTIDGRDYILVPADGIVTVNGAEVSAR